MDKERLDSGGGDLVSVVRTHLAEDHPVRCDLAGGGVVSIDRRLPFLCVYREPEGETDPGTEQLVIGQAAYLCAHQADGSRVRLSRLLQVVAEPALAQFGAFLVVTISADNDTLASRHVSAESGERLPPRPGFRILVSPTDTPWRTVEALRRALGRLRLLKQKAEVDVVTCKKPLPPEVRKIVPPALVKDTKCLFLNVQVRPVYRDAESGELYPAVLRRLQRRLGVALGQAFFTFVHTHTAIQPRHYHSLGRRALVKSVWNVDRRLADVSRSFDLLLQATPVNVEAAWRQFQRNRFEKPPVFHYRPATVEPSLLKRRLFQIPLERVEDPTLLFLFREQQDELDRRITMLSDIGTPRFLAGSMQVFGAVDDELLAHAHQLLAEVGPRKRNGGGRQIDALEFASRAREKINDYRRKYGEFHGSVVVRDDLFSGLLVSGGQLLVGRHTKVPRSRLAALIAHEVSTHLLTFFNGRAQPFRQLDAGLPGYDGLQEGLAVLSEYLVGGLTPARVRLLAARVVAVRQLVKGATFLETYRTLHQEYQFPQKTAYTIAMRVFRAGGLTKDAAYLRGLLQLLEYLKGGGDIDSLYVGKIAVEHLPIVEELRLRKILRPLPLRPDYLESQESQQRLQRAREGLGVSQMIEVSRR